MAKGRQINLDNGEGSILDGYVVDDIYAPSSFLNITFESQDKLLFGADSDYYFTYLEMDWVPISFSENKGNQGLWHYEMECYPRSLLLLVDKPVRNTIELARFLRLTLSPLSITKDIPCPVINQYAGNFIQDNRLYSLEQAANKKNLGSALYMYAGTKRLYSTTWKAMCSQTTLSFEFPENTQGTNLITYQDYQFDSLFSTANGPVPWKQKDFIGKMIGTQFKLETTLPAFFLNVYTIKIKEIPEFDTGLPFLCIYSKRSITKVDAFTHCFANIKYV